MSSNARIPGSIEVKAPPNISPRFLFWMDEIGDSWEDAADELTAAFSGSQSAARQESSIVYVVRNDDLLGRSGSTRAMVSSGLVSGARTAALEGVGKGWTANVVAYDADVNPEKVMEIALWVLNDGAITGELIHVGPGHVGKALA